MSPVLNLGIYEEKSWCQKLSLTSKKLNLDSLLNFDSSFGQPKDKNIVRVHYKLCFDKNKLIKVHKQSVFTEIDTKINRNVDKDRLLELFFRVKTKISYFVIFFT